MLGFSTETGESQSPLTGQFNFYLENNDYLICCLIIESQSPLTGQFNFYINNLGRERMRESLSSLNPL